MKYVKKWISEAGMIFSAMLGILLLPSLATGQQNDSNIKTEKTYSLSASKTNIFTRENLLAMPDAEFDQLMAHKVEIVDLFTAKESVKNTEGITFFTEADFYTLPNADKRKILANPGLFVVIETSANQAEKTKGNDDAPIKEMATEGKQTLPASHSADSNHTGSRASLKSSNK